MRSDMDHTVLSANNTISAFTRKHSPGGAITHIHAGGNLQVVSSLNNSMVSDALLVHATVSLVTDHMSEGGSAIASIPLLTVDLNFSM